jgi:hypothetical protein
MLRGFGLVLVVGAFEEFAVDEQGTGADQGDQVGALTARQRPGRIR